MAKRKPKRNVWSKEEVKELKKIYKNRSTKEAAKQLGRKETSVQAKASALGLKKNKTYLKSIGRS